jgi:flagellar biosynthesis/type III secretory pathway ATPase
VPPEDQNEPRSDTASGAIVLERNIVNRAQRVAIRSSNTASQSSAHANPAPEQSLAARLRAPFGDSEGAVESFRVVPTKTGTNGEEDMPVKLYARPKIILGKNKDGQATFTECYAVLEKIMDRTPGKGDGS